MSCGDVDGPARFDVKLCVWPRYCMSRCLHVWVFFMHAVKRRDFFPTNTDFAP